MTTYGFSKMHGLGNDFAIFDARETPLEMTSERASHIADRRHGIGCDQVIIMRPSGNADVFMEIWNADGSRVGACGNATRCVGDILLREAGTGHVSILTDSGPLSAWLENDQVIVNMGEARNRPQDIPLAGTNTDTTHIFLDKTPPADLPRPTAVNMGNPHAVFFVKDCLAVDLASIGHQLEHDAVFPEKANITIATVQGDRIRARVWERGVGITQACGTAACATLVAACRNELTGRSATVELDGGDLFIEWMEDGTVHMIGPVAYVFEGEISL